MDKNTEIQDSSAEETNQSDKSVQSQKRQLEVTRDNYSVVKTFESNSLGKKGDIYINQIVLDGLNGRKLAAALSDFSILLFDIESLTKILSFKGHFKALSDVRFSHGCDNMLWTTSVDGTIKVWDTRQNLNKPNQEFKDCSSGAAKSLLNFDLNTSNSVVCAGTELVREDAFLLFWDVRSTKLLGGYWESHTDDITQVYFHPNETNTVYTGSTDGLINVFDIAENCEDDALQATFNTYSSVNKLKWHTKEFEDASFLACLTHTDDFQLWKSIEGTLKFSHSRERLKEMFDTEYLVDCFEMNSNDEVLVLAGTEKNDGKMLSFSSNGMIISASLNNGHKGIIRSAVQFQQGIATGGEDGLLHVWQKDCSSDNGMSEEEVSLKKQCVKD